MNNLPAVSSLLLDVTRFEHAQRVSKMLSASTMVPEHFRNNVGNCVIALNYADRLGVDPFMCMTKMYIIHGKPAIETQLQIALFNKSGKFDSLKYKMSGEGDETRCVAYSTIKESGEEIEGPPVSIAMAKAEGWYGKNGSKWKTLPDLMLRYRAAAFFIRLYAPETTLGLATSEEMYDVGEIKNVTPPEEKIKAEANQGDIVDFSQGQAFSPDAPNQDQPDEPSEELSEEEKAEIKAMEAQAADAVKEAEEYVNGPGF